MAREGRTEFNEIMGDWLLLFTRVGCFLTCQVGSTPVLGCWIRPSDLMLDAPVLDLFPLVIWPFLLFRNAENILLSVTCLTSSLSVLAPNEFSFNFNWIIIVPNANHGLYKYNYACNIIDINFQIPSLLRQSYFLT